MEEPIELAAIERGAGTPVALVHGGVFHSGPAWAQTIGPLADEGYRVIAVDRRGHGRSEPGEAGRISVHLHADDLRYTLELRDARETHLVGVSYGALVCLEFALSWPDRVHSMTLIEPPMFTLAGKEPDYAPWYETFVKIGAEARRGASLTDWLPRWLSLIDASMARSITPGSSYWPLIERQAPLIFKEEAGWEYLPDRSQLAAIAIPTLILNGDQSEPPMGFIGETLAEMIPSAAHAWVGGGGHVFHAELADVFNELLIEFLVKHDPGT